MRIQIVMTLPREAVSVPLARRTVAEVLRSAGVAPDCLSEAEVALSEACTNVFHHANAGENYEVVINLGEEHLTMDVFDSGAGFGSHPRVVDMPESHAETGRGLALMTAFSDQAVFDTVTGDGGAVHLTKFLRWADESSASGNAKKHGQRMLRLVDGS
jgi:serine/threonine-protein kinase RsbW